LDILPPVQKQALHHLLAHSAGNNFNPVEKSTINSPENSFFFIYFHIIYSPVWQRQAQKTNVKSNGNSKENQFVGIHSFFFVCQ
jgi:hypothetical protein